MESKGFVVSFYVIGNCDSVNHLFMKIGNEISAENGAMICKVGNVYKM